MGRVYVRKARFGRGTSEVREAEQGWGRGWSGVWAPRRRVRSVGGKRMM